RDARFAARMCFCRIALVTFEASDQRRFPVRKGVGVMRSRARRVRSRAIRALISSAGSARQTGYLLPRFLVFRLFDVRRWLGRKLGVFRQIESKFGILNRLLRFGFGPCFDLL